MNAATAMALDYFLCKGRKAAWSFLLSLLSYSECLAGWSETKEKKWSSVVKAHDPASQAADGGESELESCLSYEMCSSPVWEA